MRDFAKISTSLWQSRKFRSLPDDDCRYLYLYLHTCRHVNSVGCFVLPEGYALTDLGWSAERFRYGIEMLSKAHLIGFDAIEGLVRIVDYLKHDPFMNQKHAAGAVKIALALPQSSEKTLLLQDLLEVRHVVDKAGIRAAIETVPIPYPKGIPPEPEPEPEPKEEQEQDGRRAAPPDPPPDTGDRLFLAVLHAVGLDRSRLSTHWMPPAAIIHVNRWVSDLGLTPDLVEQTARASRQRHPDPPNGPKALDAAMRRVASALAADPLTPEISTRPNGASHGRKSGNTERLQRIIAAAAEGTSGTGWG